jgi:protoporphyrinogen/coproporphyrinogen III oxidase
MKTAVIGGGIAGLVATYELVKAGYRPVVIEPGAFGGMIRTLSLDGFTLEQGPNVLVERAAMAELLSDLGIKDKVRYPAINPYGQFVWCRGRPMKVPSGLLEFLASPLFSWSTKLALPYRLCKRGLLKPKAEDLSVLAFFTPLIGERSVRDLLDPVLKGIYGGDVEELSARTIFPGLWEAATQGLSLIGYMRRRPRGVRPSIMVLEGGTHVVVSALAERIRGRADKIEARVERIERLAGRGYRLVCSDGSSVDVDACVVTPAGAPLASMLASIDCDLAATVRKQEYASLGVVHLSVPRKEALITDAFGVLFRAGMPNDLLGVMFNSQIFPHVAPPDKHVLTAIVGGAQARTKEFNERELRERLPAQIAELLGVSEVAFLSLTSWRDAVPQLKVGHHHVIATFDRAESANPGLVFAGVDRGGVGVTDRVRMAREAVQRLCKQVSEVKSVA